MNFVLSMTLIRITTAWLMMSLLPVQMYRQPPHQ